MKALLISVCLTMFSAFSVQAGTTGAGIGGLVVSVVQGSSYRGQNNEALPNVVAAKQNINFERLCGKDAAVIATLGKTAYSQPNTSAITDTSHGVLGGGSIGVSKATFS